MRALSKLPRVSVLMTVYNAEAYLCDAINSILNQTYTEWELIVIENGSTDGSVTILNKVTDARIKKVYLNKNIGRTPALCMAFERAQGEYVAVMDADDVSHTKRLELQIYYLETHPKIGLVGSWAKVIDKNGRKIGELKHPTKSSELYIALCYSNPFTHSSVMYRKSLAADLGGYSKRYIFAQDYALYLSLAERTKLANINCFLCSLRVFDGSMTRSHEHRRTVFEESVELLKSSVERLNVPGITLKKNKQAIANEGLSYAIYLIRLGSFIPAAKVVSFSIIQDPSIVIRAAQRSLNIFSSALKRTSTN